MEFPNCAPTDRKKDNFAVATVLRWGRCVYNNIEILMHSHLTGNMAAFVVNFAAAKSSGEVPLTEMQLIWVNVVMELLGKTPLTTIESPWVVITLVFRVCVTGRPTKKLLDMRPEGGTEPPTLNIIWRNLVAQTL
ncbi:hypothetical protein POM88_026703 [Heracleum sosnowskyi]|uniref:Uncharacterized protein n=1 Tax=Heracleum sosnowskyi TaxID=360622 RepID=A0AAD8I6D2_9APIA|nr:hypothetical protein POM88_026703 [Heracleum sosnowskyi]